MAKSKKIGLLEVLSANKRGSRTDFKKIKKAIFVLSTGRTGTQFLAQFLDKQSNVHAVHEPKPSRRLRLWTVAYLQGDVSDSKMADILRRYRGGFFEPALKKEVYVESNPFLVGFANSMKKLFKDPVIIHVVRDPREYVRSAINHGGDSGLKGFANKYLPYAHFSKKFITDKTGSKKEDMVLARTMLHWRLTNETLAQAGAGYANYHVFKFETLFGKDTKDLEKILRLAGAADYSAKDLKAKEKRANKSRLDIMPKWQKWTKEQARMLDDICGPLMRQYGYGTEPEWQEKIN